MRCAMAWWSDAARVAAVAAVLAMTCGRGAAQVAVMESYQQEAGLTDMAVSSLSQAPDGTLWIGTGTGLFTFDGFRARREPMPDGAGPGITEVQADRLKRLWVATDTGLYMRRVLAGRVHWSAVVRPDGGPLGVEGKQRLTVDDDGQVFAMDRKSRIWTVSAGAEAGPRLQALPVDVAAFEPFHGSYDAAGGPIRAVGSALWFGCGTGLCRWHDRRLQSWGPAQGLPADSWAALLASKDGSLWARGTKHLARLGPGDDRFVGVDAPAARLWPATIAMAQDAAGRILTATDDGLARWDGHAFTSWTPREGIPETAVRALLVDADDELWIGSAGRALSRWTGYGRFEHWTPAAGLPSPVVWGFQRDASGQLRVATSKGVAGLDARTQRFFPIGPRYSQSTNTRLALDDQGKLWWVDDGHVLALAPGARSAVEAMHDPAIEQALHATHSIVLAGPTTAYRIAPGTAGLQREPLPPDMPDPASLFAVINDGKDDWFLVGTAAYRIEDGRWQPLRNAAGDTIEVTQAAFSGPSELWAADARGLSIYQVSAGVARLLEHIDAKRLEGASINFVHADREGRIWVGTSQGVLLRSKGQWTLIDRSNGLLWNDMDGDAVFEDADGSMWLGSSMGATRVLPGFRAAGAPHLDVEAIQFGDGPASDIAPARVPWTDRRMRLTLRTPQIGRGRATRLEYRLDAEPSWQALEGNVLQVESLDAGDHQLQVRAAAHGGLGEAGPPTTLDFTIEAPWWRSTPARVGYLLTLAAAWALSMLGLRARAAATRQRLERAIDERTADLERSRELVRSLGVHNAKSLEEERKRVARELHDEMGQQLAALRMELSVAQRSSAHAATSTREKALGALTNRVDGLVASMRAVVGQLRPPALDGGLEVALAWLASEFERHVQVPCDVHVDDDLRRLPPDAATLIFRIAQESLSNIRRHAAAGRVHLELLALEGQCELSVEDDGRGFDVGAARSGYGILGMEERARALGGTLVLDSAPGHGTTVKLRFPWP
jgi:signal transduction histidine kinase/ligand-binding sensor domain-containing protein